MKHVFRGCLAFLVAIPILGFIFLCVGLFTLSSGGADNLAPLTLFVVGLLLVGVGGTSAFFWTTIVAAIGTFLSLDD